MARIPVAVQLYSVGEDAARDLPGTLKALAEMGYEGVEFAGYYGHSAQDLRKLLDEYGLKAAGSHVPRPERQVDQLEGQIAFHHTLGNKYLIIPWCDAGEDPAAWVEFGRGLEEAAEALAPHGLHVGYHNHDQEFHALGDTGAAAWDLIAQNSGDRVVMQLDLGNARHGGGDPVAYLKKYLHRTRTIHLKEYSATNGKATIGEGEIPWVEVLELCEGSGVTEWLIVEQEGYSVPPLEAVKRCREYLRSLGR